MSVRLRVRVEKLLQVNPSEKPAIYLHIYESAQLTSATYWLELILSAGIATLGLVMDSPAVIIGAMLISPLMGPIMSMGLALAVGDLYLGIKALLSLIASSAASIGLAAALVWALPFHSATEQILARTAPNLLDLAIAILSGLAGSLLLVRRRSGNGVTALPGVAIAVALMPPICVVGFGVGSSFNTAIISGAGLLFLTNIVAIVASAFVVFLVVGMDTAAVQQRIDDSLEARGNTEALYRWLERRFHGVFSTIGKLHWRIVMLLLLLAALFVPLRAALIRVKREAIARSAVQVALSKMVPSRFVVTQQVQYAPTGINITLFSTQGVPATQVQRAEQYVENAAGLKTTIQVQEVASRKDLSELASRLAHPAPPAPPPRPVTLSGLSVQLGTLLQKQMAALLPPGTPLGAYDWRIGSDNNVVLHIDYSAARPIDAASSAVLQQSLRDGLAMPQLNVELQRVPPTRPLRSSHGAHPEKLSSLSNSIHGLQGETRSQ